MERGHISSISRVCYEVEFVGPRKRDIPITTLYLVQETMVLERYIGMLLVKFNVSARGRGETVKVPPAVAMMADPHLP